MYLKGPFIWALSKSKGAWNELVWTLCCLHLNPKVTCVDQLVEMCSKLILMSLAHSMNTLLKWNTRRALIVLTMSINCKITRVHPGLCFILWDNVYLTEWNATYMCHSCGGWGWWRTYKMQVSGFFKTWLWAIVMFRQQKNFGGLLY